ncbi:MAG: GNA1162 family protein [Candidatus Methylacidiphilaceae bacterium]
MRARGTVTTFLETVRLRVFFVFGLFLFAIPHLVAKGTEDQRLFLPEEDADSHGRKRWYDYAMDPDPGSCTVHISPRFAESGPSRIAVLPFTDEGTGNYVLNEIQWPGRKGEALDVWRWTHSQRLRRMVHGYLAAREFDLIPVPQVDAALAAHEISSDRLLEGVEPQVLGRFLDADTLVYGELSVYRSYYLFLAAGWRVKLAIRIVSAITGREIFSGSATRNIIGLRIATNPIDLALASIANLVHLRDVTLRRGEDEACRELVLRVPHPLRAARSRAASIQKALPVTTAPALPLKAGDLPPAALTVPLRPRHSPPSSKLPPERFFLSEQQKSTHGKKNPLDYLIDLDPSRFQTIASPYLSTERPFQLAVLPFVDKATGGHYLLNGVPAKPRSRKDRERAKWTTANRFRRGMVSYLAQRDFWVQSPALTDKILQEMGWRTAEDIVREKAERVADWLGVDALVYGEIQDSVAIYAFLYSAWRVGLRVRIVSGRTAHTLIEVSGQRQDSTLLPAVFPLDIAISSVLAAGFLRDITLKRAEDELCREIALRIPTPKVPLSFSAGEMPLTASFPISEQSPSSEGR